MGPGRPGVMSNTAGMHSFAEIVAYLILSEGVGFSRQSSFGYTFHFRDFAEVGKMARSLSLWERKNFVILFFPSLYFFT